ncbi:MAG: hypothetical protein PHS45_04360 [Bacilli bacterium]|nr:hypothetical protein [Bacilli bacterium]
MYLIYRLKNNKKISVYLPHGVFEGTCLDGQTEGYYLSKKGYPKSRRIKLDVLNDKDGSFYFELRGKKKNLSEDFEYMSIDNLIDKLAKKEKVCFEEILSTLLGDTDNIGMVINDDNDLGLLYILDDSFYTKDDWGYKVSFIPEESELRDCYPEKVFYFQDLATLLLNGSIQLVNKNKYSISDNNKPMQKKIRPTNLNR